MVVMEYLLKADVSFEDVSDVSSFAVRCIPADSMHQRIEVCEAVLYPEIPHKKGDDSFGNTVITGKLTDTASFSVSISGTVSVDSSAVVNDYMSCYLYQSDMTKPDEDIRDFYKKAVMSCEEITPLGRAEEFRGMLGETVTYDRDSFGMAAASEAFASEKCSGTEIAHILMSLLRMDGIACRFLSGITEDGMCCWIEVWDDDRWKPVDPAGGKVTDKRLVLAKGRDIRDCAAEKGMVSGKSVFTITEMNLR